MSIFQEARDFVVNDSRFYNMQNIFNYYGLSGIDILRGASRPGAAIDSRERSLRCCFPETRQQYIANIMDWARESNNDRPSSIYWMKGPAGVGKSSIAQTCAERLKSTGQLGAAFFFTVDKFNDSAYLFTTLAYQLSTIFPDYRVILNDKVFKDNTLVEKTLSCQFHSLIVEPLQRLEHLGKGVGMRVIFIDGLDECADKNSQVEIIKIIACSVRERTTPFRWAVFSREEPQIVATFTNPSIASYCCCVLLPISRQADGEIELYLRGEFQHILERRNLLHLSSSWPTNEDIKKLVNAAAGLFAHPATVLRFIDQHSDSGFQESLEIVLSSIADPSAQKISPYAELDRLYTLILQRVPADVLPSMHLFLSRLTQDGCEEYSSWRAVMICNQLGISEIVFRRICHHLHAVIAFCEPPQLAFDEGQIDLARSYYDQNSSFKPGFQVDNQLAQVHGCISFYHKSFYDFLVDPTRASAFCVSTPTMCTNLFTRLVHQHLDYAASYSIQDSKLVLASSVSSSSASLSWPKGNEFIDSFLKFQAFFSVSFNLFHDRPEFGRFLRDVPLSSFQKLAEFDYRKYLVAQMIGNPPRLRKDADCVGYVGAGIVRVVDGTEYRCIRDNKFALFSPTAFFMMVEKFEKSGVIRPYCSYLGSSWPASILSSNFLPQRRNRSCHGQYKLGHGDKSVVWYWEFNVEMQYFHEFRTTNYVEAKRMYRKERFRMWEESWAP